MGKLLNWFKGSKEEKEAEKRTREELDELTRRYGDGNTLDPDKAREYLLHVGLRGLCGTPETVEGDHLLLPEWNAVLTPSVDQLTQQGAVLSFRLYAPQWGKELYECCAGMGSDTKTALGISTGSFAFSFMQGLARMEGREECRPLASSFAGREHRWRVYLSDIVGMGKLLRPKRTDPAVYWEALKDDIVKRLGNQKLCYVKIYGAKVGDDVTGECRIDDIKSDELSAKVAQLVERWEVEGFASQKQFFFIRQEESTLLPSPYDGPEGQAALKDKVVRAARMFHESQSQERFDTLPQRLAEALGDPTLAEECLTFLPEICAENAYQDEVAFAESLQLLPSGESALAQIVYKNQLADFYPMWKALFDAFDEGAFGEETNDVYRELISYSATFSSIAKAKEKNPSLKGGRLAALLCQVSGEFEIR